MTAGEENGGISRVGLVVDATAVEEVGRRCRLRHALAKDWDGAPETPMSGTVQGRRTWAEPKKCWESREGAGEAMWVVVKTGGKGGNLYFWEKFRVLRNLRVEDYQQP